VHTFDENEGQHRKRKGKLQFVGVLMLNDVDFRLLGGPGYLQHLVLNQSPRRRTCHSLHLYSGLSYRPG